MLYGSAALGIALLSSPDAIRSALTASASALVEAAPFVFGVILLASLFRRRHHIATYLGCGCTSGPSARSIPVTAATWLLFGPQVALARWTAAMLVARILRRHVDFNHDGDWNPLAQLAAMLPAVALAGATTQIFTLFDISRLSPLDGALAGATLGFLTAPCGQGRFCASRVSSIYARFGCASHGNAPITMHLHTCCLPSRSPSLQCATGTRSSVPDFPHSWHAAR